MTYLQALGVFLVVVGLAALALRWFIGGAS